MPPANTIARLTRMQPAVSLALRQLFQYFSWRIYPSTMARASLIRTSLLSSLASWHVSYVLFAATISPVRDLIAMHATEGRCMHWGNIPVLTKNARNSRILSKDVINCDIMLKIRAELRVSLERRSLPVEMRSLIYWKSDQDDWEYFILGKQPMGL